MKPVKASKPKMLRVWRVFDYRRPVPVRRARFTT
jgi:hypothetical protein